MLSPIFSSPMAVLPAEGFGPQAGQGYLADGKQGVRGGDLSMKLEKLIGDHFRQKGRTLSVAESCTGGMICDRITNISGSSDYFMGGMVTYSNESKTKHLDIPFDCIKKYGAVSSPVAKRMAQGVRKAFNTTFGLSTTGVAGPTGGTKRAPVGRVFIGLAQGRRTWVKQLDLKGSRRDIKKQSAERSLEFLYQMMVQKAGLQNDLQKPNLFQLAASPERRQIE
jgi:nicotinamide-nucleotide amidase